MTSSTLTGAAISTADWPYLWAAFYAAILIIISISTFTPAGYDVCEQGGFPQPRNQPLNVYVYLFAGCQFQVGLSVAVLLAAGEWRALSAVIACATPMGLVGTTLSATRGGMGFGKAFFTHCVLMTIGTSAAWRLMQENW